MCGAARCAPKAARCLQKAAAAWHRRWHRQGQQGQLTRAVLTRGSGAGPLPGVHFGPPAPSLVLGWCRGAGGWVCTWNEGCVSPRHRPRGGIWGAEGRETPVRMRCPARPRLALPLAPGAGLADGARGPGDAGSCQQRPVQPKAAPAHARARQGDLPSSCSLGSPVPGEHYSPWWLGVAQTPEDWAGHCELGELKASRTPPALCHFPLRCPGGSCNGGGCWQFGPEGSQHEISAARCSAMAMRRRTT